MLLVLSVMDMRDRASITGKETVDVFLPILVSSSRHSLDSLVCGLTPLIHGRVAVSWKGLSYYCVR